ncbi:MAG: penicillin-binding protein [Dermatophilaceae bacterium]
MSGRATNVSGVMKLLAAFLAAAGVMGLLTAGVVMPAVGAAGAATRAGVDLFDSLPGEFTTSPLSEQSVILNADGSQLATPYDENRVIVPLSEIAPIMRTAQVAIEDHRFYEHGGADLQGIVRAFISNQSSGGVTGGGSTLTQQYVKITLQENAVRTGDTDAARKAIAQNYGRKIQELKYAVQLEKTLTKDQILEGYLNLVYYGDRAYGVEAAAEHYFSKHAKELTLTEAALLAGVVQNPGTTDPINFPDKALARRNVVLDRMHELKLISDKDWTDAKAVKLADILHPKAAQNSCQSSKYPYFCDYVIAYLKQDPSLDAALGTSEKDRINAIYRGGLTIQTTLDPRIMDLAREKLVERVPVGNGEDIGAATAVIDVKTGGVKAIAQNTEYKLNSSQQSETTVNWAVDTKYGGSLGFGFGSTIKAFALVTALESGIPTSASVYAKSGPAVYTGRDIGGDCGLGGSSWPVRNDESITEGNMSLAQATSRSINTAFVGLAIRLKDICKIRETEWRMGLHQTNGEKIKPFPAAIILGADSVSPMTVASAYQTLANEGKYCTPTPIISITKAGQALPVPAPGSQCEQRVDPDVARGVTSLLTGPLRSGGTAQRSALAGGRPAAGKTGTTDRNNETWFVGFTPELSTAVWVGTPNDPGNTKNLDGIRLGGSYYGTVFGASIAAPVWKGIMDASLEGTPATPFTQASDKVTNGEMVDIPSVLRRSLDDARALLDQAGFSVSTRRTYSNYAVGTIVGTSPGNRAIRGSVVTILISAGPAPAPAPTPDPAAPPPPGG